jgi:hypothetical protein
MHYLARAGAEGARQLPLSMRIEWGGGRERKKETGGGDVTEADGVPVEGSLLLPPGRWWVSSMAPPSPGSDARQSSLKRSWACACAGPAERGPVALRNLLGGSQPVRQAGLGLRPALPLPGPCLGVRRRTY